MSFGDCCSTAASSGRDADIRLLPQRRPQSSNEVVFVSQSRPARRTAVEVAAKFHPSFRRRTMQGELLEQILNRVLVFHLYKVVGIAPENSQWDLS
jgi:hypothetical protein